MPGALVAELAKILIFVVLSAYLFALTLATLTASYASLGWPRLWPRRTEA
jgi:predicted ABC-type exoprotein transport system permease subunit